MNLIHLPASGHKVTQWKNGGGQTAEIACAPEGVSMDDFHWRVSMAMVDRAGPFSVFDGIDRHLTLLSGRLRLDMDGQSHLMNAFDAILFAGETAVHGTPVDGPASDINVMTRRSLCSARVRILPPYETVEIEADTALIVTLPPARPDALRLEQARGVRWRNAHEAVLVAAFFSI